VWKLIAEIKFFNSKLPREPWLRVLVITSACLTFLTVTIVICDFLALLYLYSFDRDPKNWTNLNFFYSRPKSISMTQAEPLAAVVVRGENRQSLARNYHLNFSDIAGSALHDCVLVTEDRYFYVHTGVNYGSLLRVAYDAIIRGRLRGGSTITNQVIRTIILAERPKSGLRRFLQEPVEILLATTAERHFSKEDLLVAYSNNAYLGHVDQVALIGFSAAAQSLFGKRDPKVLTLSEAAVLSGMLHAPNHYLAAALKGDYEKARRRSHQVLDSLFQIYPDRYSRGMIARAKRERITFLFESSLAESQSRQFIRYASQSFNGHTGPGLRLITTLDRDLQTAAHRAVESELTRFDREPYGFYNRLSYRHSVKNGRKVTDEEAKLQAALVALDARTGEILAMLGGRNSGGEFNRATQAKRAPASAVKPFIYLYGIKFGFLNGVPFRADTVIDPNNVPITQRYSTAGAARARVQLARSDNGAAVAIGHEFGAARLKQFLGNVLGINPLATEMLAIGAGKGSEGSPLRLAEAYTIFANSGVKVPSEPVWAVHDGASKLTISKHKAVRVIDPGAPFIVTRMLQSVIGDGLDGQYGTAKMARQLSGLGSSVALAGKTGTGDGDLWFVGFTPRIVVVVWVGFDNNFPPFEASKGFTGSGLPLQIWARFMKEVKKYRPDFLGGSFEMPAGVRELTIDPERNCISHVGMKEYFLVDRRPPGCEYLLSAKAGR
jgi:penicillin-binding protein 1B